MAVFITSPDDTPHNPHEVEFAAIWKHYNLANFLYPAKLERLRPEMDRISKGWSTLLSVPAEIFHIHLACRDRTILSSVCAFRDTTETYVVQHAVSQDQPQHMIECLLSITSKMGEDLDAHFISMNFRPENRWPTRLMWTVRDAHPPELTHLITRDYFICDTRNVATLPVDSQVEELEVEANSEASSLVVTALGPLRARAAGVGAGRDDLKSLTERYSRFGLLRERKILGVTRDGALAGIALCYVTGFPVNFSFLCGRVEILVHPEAPDRAGVVRDLARAAIREATLRKVPVCALLIDPSDAQAAVAGGFDATGKQYSTFLWARESAEGWPSTAIAFERWYARIGQRYARTGQPSEAHLLEHS